MSVRLRKGSNRNTQAHIVSIGQYDLFFSYETCIAVSTPFGNFRIENYWGPTTGRHFRETGVDGFNMVEDREAFEKAVDSIGTPYAKRRMVALAKKYNPNYSKEVA